MDFRTILGYPVQDSKIQEQCVRHGIDISKVDYLVRLGSFITRCGCPIEFYLERKEDRKGKRNVPFIMTIYEGPKKTMEGHGYG